MKDLFEHYSEQPKELKAICDKWEEKSIDGLSYEDCANFLKEVEAIGYTFDYYLDAEPYDLRPISEAVQLAVNWLNERVDEKDDNNGLHYGIYTFDCTVEDFDPEAGYGSYDITNAEWYATEKERDLNLNKVI